MDFSKIKVLREEESERYKGELLTREERDNLKVGEMLIGKQSNSIYDVIEIGRVRMRETGVIDNARDRSLCWIINVEDEIKAVDF